MNVVRLSLLIALLLGVFPRPTFASEALGKHIQKPPPVSNRSLLMAATQANPELTAAAIIAQAHLAAGGPEWVRPNNLKLTGYNLIRRGAKEVVWDKYAMWRVYAKTKSDSHTADGKVRIEAWSKGKLALLLSFDGHKTYNQDGAMEDQSANAMWGANFGYGAIRNALDTGWQQKRLPDDLIDGKPAYMVELTDPSGGTTRFGIRHLDSYIVYVGFDTPRGWHERRYSNFFSKPGVRWNQPGRVRLSYDGVKANEAIWTDFSLNNNVDDDFFEVIDAPESPTF